MINNARLSFPNLFKAKAFQDGDPKYSASFMISKDDPQVKMIIDTVKELTAEFKGAKFKNHAIVDGDDEGREECKGMYIIKAKAAANRKPLTVDMRARVRDDEAFESELYAGCYVNADLSLYTLNNSYGKMLCCGLNAVQKFSEGEHLGSVPTNRFSALEEEDTVTNNTDASSDVASLFG